MPGLRMMTIAPSVDAKSGYARIRHLLDRGDCCSNGCRHCPYAEA